MKKFFMGLFFPLLFASSTFAQPPMFANDGLFGNDITVNDQITLTDGTNPHLIKSVTEAGPVGSFRIAVDETDRLAIICDYGDVDVDFANAACTDPTLQLRDAGGTWYADLTNTGITHSNTARYTNSGVWEFRLGADISAGNWVEFESLTGVELTDDNAEQSWLALYPKYNGANTSPFNAIQVKATETLLGTGGANFAKFGTSSNDDLFIVENTGAIEFDGHTKVHAAVTTLSTAQVNAVRGTPITVVAAQGANTWIELVSAVITYDYATAAFTVAADEDLVIEYADGTDTTASIETTGFLDQGDDEIRFYPSALAAGADIEATINQALQIFNTGAGETADGGGEVDVRVVYRVYVTGF